jgi:membrane protein YqaA with SNARE-associated domain
MGEDASLWTLFASSFLAATLLPGGSEPVLFAVVKGYPSLLAAALAVATLGNTLGGMTSYCIGRFVARVEAAPGTRAERWQTRARAWTQRYGAPVLLLAWVPLIGDPLCLVAGWLRLHWLSAAIFIALGKLARYMVIAWTAT